MALSDSLERLAPAPTLLVASDYDGTLSPSIGRIVSMHS